MPSSQPAYTVRHATTDDIPSLTTIVPRAFHPTNPYILKLFPNTPALQQWWSNIFASKISNPKTSHLLTACSSETTDSLGLLSMQHFSPTDTGAGLYTSFPPTPDHDASSYTAVASGLARAREEMVAGSEHFVIELFGVDHAAKGLGLGLLLLRKACEIADAAGLPIFVMANASAQGIYPRVGFELRRVEVMPGELKYEEFMLVRPAQKGGRRS